MAKIKIIKDEENPEPTPILAKAVLKISEAMEKLQESGINERAIIVLTIDACESCIPSGYSNRKPRYREVKAIFDSLKQLRAWYCK